MRETALAVLRQPVVGVEFLADALDRGADRLLLLRKREVHWIYFSVAMPDGKPVSTFPGIALVLAPNRALVPVAQRQMGDPAGEKEDRDAGERDHQQGGEHARDLQPVAGFEDAVGKSRRAAAGA